MAISCPSEQVGDSVYSCCRYDVAWYLAGLYKWLAKFLFMLQLFVSLLIVILSTLYAASGGRNEDGSGDWWVDWWIVSDSLAINYIGHIIFGLTIFAFFLIALDSYINAKASSQPITLLKAHIASSI